MTYRRTVRFKREFKVLPAEIKRAARAKFALFSVNWRHPSLRCHKLEGVLWHDHQVFDLYVTDKYRVLFVIDHDVVVSFSIGPHSIVSKQEDIRMDREYGAAEACAFVKRLSFKPSAVAFDAAFEK